jgi:RNA polymerase sigma factor (TIGR02999 family)
VLEPHEVTQLLHELRHGDESAASKLMPVVYGELRRLAGHYMGRERSDHTLQPTALVHEAFLRMVDQGAEWQNRAHFFGVAAQLMRQILVDYARTHRAAKRGGNQQRVPLEDNLVFSEDQSAELLALNEALERLAEFDARQARIVEMRFFAGLSVDETAEVLGVSGKTVQRDWNMARAWLHRELGTPAASPE